MKKTYKVGMYGGKFYPFHRGHMLCIDTAAKECDLVYIILFYNGQDERECEVPECDPELLTVDFRINAVKEYCRQYDNVIFVPLNDAVIADYSEMNIWDAETQYVLAMTGGVDAAYSSEPKYGEYFAHAYPGCTHRLVDPPRVIEPISATEIRAMKDKNKINYWITKRA